MPVIRISSTIRKMDVIPSTGVLDPTKREHAFISSINVSKYLYVFISRLKIPAIFVFPFQEAPQIPCTMHIFRNQF
jgi:hypothetical protein